MAGATFALRDQVEIIRWLWRNKSVNELVDSILTSGFWTHEELFATRSGRGLEEGELIVVEGNRRLAAVKVILNPDLRKELRTTLPIKPTQEVLDTLSTLPIIISDREALWEFVGFKHVNGPQAWDSISKAQYVFEVNRDFDIPLDRIAQSIGDRHDTVVRLYRGYTVLRQAEETLDFDPEDCHQRRFPFSHLWTALGYTSIMSFLGVTSESLEQPNPVPSDRLENLRSLILWLFGSDERNISPKVRRQNPDLRHLAEALGDEEGVEILRADLPLETALEAAKGDAELFSNALTTAVHHLKEAKRFVATGFHGNDDQLEKARTARILILSLLKEMQSVPQETPGAPPA